MANVTIFISYSRKDTSFADRLKADLRASGAAIWIDHESLEPGAPDWQAAIRRGIEAATAVVYVGSPDAANSGNVRAEIVIATEEKRQIYSMWARGELWSKCAPFELIGSNYLDARGAKYGVELTRLQTALGLIADLESQSMPRVGFSPPKHWVGFDELAHMESGDSTIESVAWSPDGTRLATSGSGQKVRIWDAMTGQLLTILEDNWVDIINEVSWAPDCARLASANGDGSVRIWKPASGQLISSLAGHAVSRVAGGVWTVAWSPDGSRLASGGYDKTVRIWDPATGQAIFTLEGHSSSVLSVAWSPDSKRLASGGGGLFALLFGLGDKTARIWDPTTGRLLTTLKEHDSAVRSVAWAPNGTRLATSSDDKTIRIWDTASWRVLFTLSAHADTVYRIAWKHDSSRLASCSDDETIRIWDPATGHMLTTIPGHKGRVTSVAWAPNGSRLASGGYDKTIRIWEIRES